MNLAGTLLLLFLMMVAGKKSGENSGPYRMDLVSVAPCKNTTYPISKDPPMLMYMEAYRSPTTKNTLLRGNYTVFKETKQVKLKIKSYLWEDNKWKLSYLINDLLRCGGVMLDIMIRAWGSEHMFDVKKCAFNKGQLVIKDMDINLVQHMWNSKLEYGRTLWRSEVTAGRATFSCWDFVTLVERI